VNAENFEPIHALAAGHDQPPYAADAELDLFARSPVSSEQQPRGLFRSPTNVFTVNTWKFRPVARCSVGARRALRAGAFEIARRALKPAAADKASVSKTQPEEPHMPVTAESRPRRLPKIALASSLGAVAVGLAVFLCRGMWSFETTPDQAGGRAAWSLSASMRALTDKRERMAEIDRIIAARQRAAVPLLAQRVRDEKDEEFRIACIRALGATGDGRAAFPLVGVAESPNETDAVHRRFLPDGLGKLDVILLTAALVNYPLGLQHERLHDPDARMIAGRQESHVVMLSGGERNIQCQVALRDEKPRLIGSEIFVPRAGAMLLHGLGVDWIAHGPAPGGRHEAVVVLEGASNTGPSRVLDFQSDARGTAALDLDLSPVYRREDGRPVEARRQIAADFSGRSGADAILVIFDRVRGAGKKTWTLPMGVQRFEHAGRAYHSARIGGKGAREYIIERDPGLEAAGAPGATRTANEFALRAERAGSVRGVILRPAACEVTFVPTVTKGPMPVLQASASAEEVEFLVVLTMQKAAPPAIALHGEGPDTVVTIGRQKARLTAGKLTWDPPTGP
jgi:hypothetical protein